MRLMLPYLSIGGCHVIREDSDAPTDNAKLGAVSSRFPALSLCYGPSGDTTPRAWYLVAMVVNKLPTS